MTITCHHTSADDRGKKPTHSRSSFRSNCRSFVRRRSVVVRRSSTYWAHLAASCGPSGTVRSCTPCPLVVLWRWTTGRGTRSRFHKPTDTPTRWSPGKMKIILGLRSFSPKNMTWTYFLYDYYYKYFFVVIWCSVIIFSVIGPKND